jgi:hypothetical protein
MKCEIVINPDMAHHVTHANALQLGMQRSGIATRIVSVGERIQHEPDTIAACWGWRIGAMLDRAGFDVLVMEHGFIGDRRHWTSLGWNGLNGRARFAYPADETRFEANFGDLLQPCDASGTYALLIGQVEGDASIDNIDFRAWCEETAARATERLGLPVFFRPHPVAVERGQWTELDNASATLQLEVPLREALQGAAVVLTYNSNAGTDAVLAGKPTICFDRGAMAWPVAAHGWEIRAIEEGTRKAWCDRLAWSQFSIAEIIDGAAWEQVSKAYG